MIETGPVPRLAELLNLDGQRVLVTGASGNIGRGIALRLAEAGADVVVHYHADEDGASQTVSAITAAGRAAEPVQADLGNPDEVEAMFANVVDGSAPVTHVVNNAGNFPVHPFTDMSVAEWRGVMAANLDSAVYVCREAIRRW